MATEAYRNDYHIAGHLNLKKPTSILYLMYRLKKGVPIKYITLLFVIVLVVVYNVTDEHCIIVIEIYHHQGLVPLNYTF